MEQARRRRRRRRRRTEGSWKERVHKIVVRPAMIYGMEAVRSNKSTSGKTWDGRDEDATDGDGDYEDEQG